MSPFIKMPLDKLAKKWWPTWCSLNVGECGLFAWSVLLFLLSPFAGELKQIGDNGSQGTFSHNIPLPTFTTDRKVYYLYIPTAFITKLLSEISDNDSPVVYHASWKEVTIQHNVDGLVQDCTISIAWAMEILQSCIKPPICQNIFFITTIFTSQIHPRERWNIGFVLRNMLVEEMA